MKTRTLRQEHILPVFRQTLTALVAMSMTSHAALLVNESFTGYSDGAINGQAVNGTGLTGSWSGGAPILRQSAGLTMNGVYSSPGSAVIRNGTPNTYKVTAALQSPLPTGQLYGSYLFSTTVQSDARSVGLVAVGASDDGDGTASFVWAGNGYSVGDASLEGPGVRVEGSTWQSSTPVLNASETYLMIFEFNAINKTTSAWVLNQDQLAYHRANAFTGIALNLASLGTSEHEVVWKGSATGTPATGAMTHLHLIALGRSTGFEYTWDEFRISDTSLLEAVVVPEPSSFAFSLAAGAFMLRRRRVS